MNILLVNPPNCGRSIPEERYGIDSMKQIFRGEPLALEFLAGNLEDHDIRIVDLKVEPGALQKTLSEFTPDIAGITGVTCEANAMLELASEIKDSRECTVVAGGIHASNDPEFFNRSCIDYVSVGLGVAGFGKLAAAIESGDRPTDVPGMARTTPGKALSYVPGKFDGADLLNDKPPRPDLVAEYRDSYILSSLKLTVGFVATAFGCPYNCSFCCISALTGGKYLSRDIEAVLRDIRLMDDLPVIRLIDANTFGNPEQARKLCEAIVRAGIKKNFIADARADTVVRHTDLFVQWKEAGLRAVVIGFEEISDDRLAIMNKAGDAAANAEAIRILHDIGITIVGDFIISPDYDEDRFEALGRYIEDHPIDLPMLSVLTPLPGTPLYETMKDRISIHDLDFYTLTNAVVPTALDEKVFYENYAALIKASHAGAKL